MNSGVGVYCYTMCGIVLEVEMNVAGLQEILYITDMISCLQRCFQVAKDMKKRTSFIPEHNPPHNITCSRFSHNGPRLYCSFHTIKMLSCTHL